MQLLLLTMLHQILGLKMTQFWNIYLKGDTKLSKPVEHVLDKFQSKKLGFSFQSSLVKFQPKLAKFQAKIVEFLAEIIKVFLSNLIQNKSSYSLKQPNFNQKQSKFN